MTAHSTFAPSSLGLSDDFIDPIPATSAADIPFHAHRRAVLVLCAIVLAPVIFLSVYGAKYYTLSQADRPFSPKHHLLKPSGAIAINMGISGVLMLCTIFIYPLRKRWAWLRRQGSSQHWLDYHVILGTAAPVFIAFHSSFKFRGLAGIAFWVMVGVAVSGLVGRYLYALVLRGAADAESNLKEFHRLLLDQTAVPRAHLRPLMHLPTFDQAARWPMCMALGYVLGSDLLRPFRIARLRARGMRPSQLVFSLGGLRPSNHVLLEWVIALARKQAALSTRKLFLSQLQGIFRLWHVIHRPFSYAFAFLALLHIFVAMMMGFI